MRALLAAVVVAAVVAAPAAAAYPAWVWFTTGWARGQLARSGVYYSADHRRYTVTNAVCNGVWSAGTRAAVVDRRRGVYVTMFKQARCRIRLAGGPELVGVFTRTGPGTGFVITGLRVAG